MREVTKEERPLVLSSMGIGSNAWWRRCNRPGLLTMQEADALKAFLDRKYGRDHDMHALRTESV